MAADMQTEKELFFQALDIASPAERQAFIESACAGRPTLKAAILALLQAHDRLDNPVDRPVVERDRMSLDQLSVTKDVASRVPGARVLPDTRIGPYRLMEQIGEGGFGLVFVADQQEPVRRRVALKIIKPGMESREVLARFEAERQAIALMDHPNIARIYDAGATESGQPYFVMELVRGVPLTTFCDRQKLAMTERLHLFVMICQAVQHAHQKGIIHRDLKPSNILVTLQDGQPLAKVIDFGVAKAIGQSLSANTIYTRFAAMIGTPAYMSPEQAELSAADVDTRSDIYSLGVLLYELVTGSTPFAAEQLQSAGFDEMRRMIREEEPPRPSNRLNTLKNEQATTVAANRRLDPTTLATSLKRDLDWIVMKALDKDRNRRYSSAGSLAQDVTRYLMQQPVEARPPSSWYRLAKFARRNKVAISSITMVATALVIGSVVSISQARVALRERDEKELALKDARAAASAARAAQQELEEFTDRLEACHVLIASARSHLDAERFAEANRALSDAIAVQPRYFLGWLERGRMNAKIGRWNQAAQDFAQALRIGLPLDKAELLGIQQVFMYVGELEAYANLRSALDGSELSPHAVAIRGQLVGELTPEAAAGLAAHLEALLAQSASDTSAPKLCDPSTTEQPRRASAKHPFARMHRGVDTYLAGWAHLRAGQWEQAVARLEQSNGSEHFWHGRGIGDPLLAIAHHQMGNSAASLEAFARAEQFFDRRIQEAIRQSQGVPPLPWIDWIEFLLHYRQASILIKGHTPAIEPQLRQLASFAEIAVE